MFQNKFEIKIFENGGDFILGAKLCWKNVLRDVTRTGLIWNKPN